MDVHNSKSWYPKLYLRIPIIVKSRSEMWMYGQPKLIMDIHDWLIMNIHDSIVGIHKTVMDIRNLIFTILNFRVYP